MILPKPINKVLNKHRLRSKLLPNIHRRMQLPKRQPIIGHRAQTTRLTNKHRPHPIILDHRPQQLQRRINLRSRILKQTNRNHRPTTTPTTPPESPTTNSTNSRLNKPALPAQPHFIPKPTQQPTRSHTNPRLVIRRKTIRKQSNRTTIPPYITTTTTNRLSTNNLTLPPPIQRPRKRRNITTPINPKEPLSRPLPNPRPIHRVRNPRRHRTNPVQHTHMPDHPRLHRHTPTLPIPLRRVLSLQPRNINIARTLRLASLATQTQIKRLDRPSIIPISPPTPPNTTTNPTLNSTTSKIQLPSQRKPKRIPTPSRRVPFIQRPHITRAHHPARPLPAHTRPITHLNRVPEPLLIPIIKVRINLRHTHRSTFTSSNRIRHRHRPSPKPRRNTLHRPWRNNVPRIQQIQRIKDRLHLAERTHQLTPIKPLKQRPTNTPITVLTAHHTTNTPSKIRSLNRDHPQPFTIPSIMQINHRPDMQHTNRSVRPIRRNRPMPTNNLLKLAHKLAKPLNRNRVIFHKRHRLA